MRIVGGEWGGRPLVTPAGSTTRPTSDALRETIFNVLDHGLGHTPVHVLDLFAGTGALAFEALSRGAETAIFVEADPKALTCIRRNIDALKVASNSVRIFDKDRVESWGRWLAEEAAGFVPFDTIFCDPPYEKNLPARAMRVLDVYAAQLFTPETVLVLEISTREKEPILETWEVLKDRVRGSTRVIYYRRKA